MNIVWEETAEVELISIFQYVVSDSPRAASWLYGHIKQHADSLGRFPERYRQGSEPRSRELSIPKTPYILVYRVEGATVRILSVFHAAQDKPRGAPTHDT